MRTTRWLAACALLAIGCEAGAATTVVGKSAGAGDELGALEIDSTAASRAPRPARPRDLVARASGPSPIGPLTDAHRSEYVVQVEMVSRAERSVALERGVLQVAVAREGRVLRGCDRGEPVALESPRVVLPGESLVVTGMLPCAIERTGDYEVIASIELGDPERATDGELVARMPLTIEGTTPFSAR